MKPAEIAKQIKVTRGYVSRIVKDIKIAVKAGREQGAA